MLAAIFMFLVKAALWLLFIGVLINIFGHWINTGESPVAVLTAFINTQTEKRLQSRQDHCEHDWYDLETQTKLQDLEMYQFAYRFLDVNETQYDKRFYLIEPKDRNENGELVVAERLPTQNELQKYHKYYCPKCKYQLTFAVEKVCSLAIEDRKRIEAEKGRAEIERIYNEINAKKEAGEKK